MIDWTTVAFQILNFLILLVLLTWLLYGRIIKAMDEREARIAQQIHDAEAKKAEAEKEAASYQQKNQELDAQREEMLAKAKAEADAHRKELMHQARQEVEALQARWREAVERERAAFLQDLRQRAAKQTLGVARRVLADLAGADLEGRILDVFLQRLERLPDEEWKALADAAPADDQGRRELALRSVFDLPDDRRQRVAEIVRDRAGDGVDLRHEKAFDLVCGIELRAPGRKVAWCIADYLAALEEGLGQALQQQPSPAALKAKMGREEEQEAVGSQQSAGRSGGPPPRSEGGEQEAAAGGSGTEEKEEKEAVGSRQSAGTEEEPVPEDKDEEKGQTMDQAEEQTEDDDEDEGKDG